jgi:molybdenum cofactor guanylyltransferase
VSVTGIVLAGGRSSRFGGSKLDEELDGTPILARAIDAVAMIADEVLVAGGHELPGLVPDGGGNRPTIRLVADAEPFAGPLAALAGALDQATGELAIVVGGDMPRLVPEVLQAMLERLAAQPAEAIILGTPGEGKEGVTAIGETARRQVFPLAVDIGPAAAAARAAMREGGRAMQAVLDRLDVGRIPFAEWSALDPAAGTLLDVDARSDLDRIRALDGGGNVA